MTADAEAGNLCFSGLYSPFPDDKYPNKIRNSENSTAEKYCKHIYCLTTKNLCYADELGVQNVNRSYP